MGWPTDIEGNVVRIAAIEGMVHLIALDPKKS